LPVEAEVDLALAVAVAPVVCEQQLIHRFQEFHLYL
jgi:hypothetical protein